MGKAGPWQRRAVCNKCGWHFKVNHYDSQITWGIGVCPECGNASPTWKRGRDDNWHLATMRWVDDGVWWKPWTWDKGHWEIKGA